MSRTRSGVGTTVSSTGTTRPTNTRTRLVGARTGPMADAIVTAFRIVRAVGHALARLWRRISGVITPLGWVVLIAAPTALIAGTRLGLLEAVAVGVVGSILVVVGLVSLLGRTRFDVRFELDHLRIVVGAKATATLVAANPARRRMLGATVEVPVGEFLAEVAVPALAVGAEYRHSLAVPTEHRGIVRMGPVRAVRGDPVGLMRREIVWAEAVDVIVHPRIVAVPSTSTGLIRDLEGVPTRDLTDSDISFHALREYLPGDDRRFIHWRSTAKTGRYMVRQFEQTRRSHLVVGLSLAARDYADPDEFELAVSVAGSLGVRAIHDGRTVSVAVSEKTPEFAKRTVYGVRQLATGRADRLLDDLAVVETSAPAIGLREVARVVADTVTGVSVAYLVCGSATPAVELRAATAAFPPDVDVVVVVCDPTSTAGLRRTPGLNVLKVGLLDDLRSALVRAVSVG